MHVIKADPHRQLQLAGVPQPVHRPVDIDQAQTGFAVLRSLRIYCFTAGSVIDGHAEEDEVLIVVLAGSVHLTMSEGDIEEHSPEFILSAPGDSPANPCVAYLPPHGAYRLTPRGDAEVAYARATPSAGRPPAVFSSKIASSASTVLLFQETTYPQHLRLRIVGSTAAHETSAIMPIEPSESGFEGLVHVRTDPPFETTTLSAKGSGSIVLDSWDTVAVRPGEWPTFHIAGRSSALLLIVLATA